MPRPWEEMVEEFPALSERKWYRVLITEVERQRGIVLTLEFVDEPQAGRELVYALRLPLRPAGVAASCFKAAGLTLQAGKKVSPKQLRGHMLLARFALANTAEWVAVGFRTLLKEAAAHESDPAS